MPIDYTTPIGQVRLLSTDVSEPFIFEDDAVTAFLELTSGNIKRSAAFALLAIASDEVLVGKVLRTDDLQVSSHLVAEQLRKQARDLNDQADADDTRNLNDDFRVVFGDRHPFVPEGTVPPVYGRILGVDRWR